MNSLFGAELPTAVNFVIAFVVVLILIAAAAWLVRRFGAARLDSAARGRQPRLAVIDSAAVDGRRKLVIVRRDNVEHLLMIGGPSDVVVETNIVRAAAMPTRDAPAARNGAAPAIDPTPWPLQPEPALAPAAPVYAPPPAPPSAPPLAPTVRAERAPRMTAADSWPEPAEPVAPAPPVRASRPAETLAGLADELAQPAREPARSAAPPVVATGAAYAPPVADQSLAEMAQRLEAALRRPAARRLGSEGGGGRVTVIAESKSATREPRLAVAASKDSAAPSPAQTSAQSPAQPRTPTNSDLEQEMATLLGRPGKT
ncbi:MAG: FliO/MopB family protein [Rhizobiales bacterium]|jgi:flagellar biogenesis protein FliO|nr:FliO/MopB family protein [Hyphomicrobiales bacterium]